MSWDEFDLAEQQEKNKKENCTYFVWDIGIGNRVEYTLSLANGSWDEMQPDRRFTGQEKLPRMTCRVCVEEDPRESQYNMQGRTLDWHLPVSIASKVNELRKKGCQPTDILIHFIAEPSKGKHRFSNTVVSFRNKVPVVPLIKQETIVDHMQEKPKVEEKKEVLNLKGRTPVEQEAKIWKVRMNRTLQDIKNWHTVLMLFTTNEYSNIIGSTEGVKQIVALKGLKEACQAAYDTAIQRGQLGEYGQKEVMRAISDIDKKIERLESRYGQVN